MCCCGKPVVNGEPGYSWDGKTFGVRPVDPPPLEDGDSLLFDEPGRCGGLDCHCHHFRIVKERFGGHCLLVQHGGGNERIKLGCVGDLVVKDGSLAAMDSNTRYWWMHLIYSAQSDSARKASEKTTAEWRKAAAEKRIKTRKVKGGVKVWIEDRPAVAMA